MSPARAKDTHVDERLLRQALDLGTYAQLVALVDTQGNQLGGAVNLYMNGHAFKLQADYFVLFGAAPDQRHVVRLQLDTTF